MISPTIGILKSPDLGYLNPHCIPSNTNWHIFPFLVIEKAVDYLERDELPPHWDKEILFNMGEESATESSESEEIDDDDDTESPEEKDHLVNLAFFKTTSSWDLGRIQ